MIRDWYGMWVRPESVRLLSRSPEYWLHHMGRDRTMLAAQQLQHDAGLILSNVQVLGQFVTSLNRMSSEVMSVTFTHKPFSTEAVQFVAPSHRVQQAAYYMAAMGTVASTVYAGDSGTSTIFFMQCVHDMFGLLSCLSEVEKTGVWLTLCFVDINCRTTILVLKRRLL